MSSSLSTLERLPPELFLKIVDEFEVTYKFDADYPEAPEVGTRTAFLQLAKCSKHLHRLMMPLLYKNVIQTRDKTVASFLRHVLRNPDAGQHVKKVLFGRVDYDDNDDDMKLSARGFTATDLDICEELMSIFSSETFAWSLDMKFGEWSALIALLLAQLPALEEITFCGTHWFAQYIDNVFKIASRLQKENRKSLHSLSKLKSITFHYDWRQNEDFPIERLVPLLCLPSVERFHVSKLGISESGFDSEDDELDSFHGRYDDDDDDENESFARKLPDGLILQNIKYLEMDHCIIEGQKLVEFIKCFPALEVLEFVHASKPPYGGMGWDDDEFNSFYLHRAISHLKPSLQTLKAGICRKFQNRGYDDEEEEGTVLGSLADFEKLKEIEVDGKMLLGTENHWSGEADDNENGKADHKNHPSLVTLLPKSLEKLKIEKDSIDPSHVTQMAQRKKELLPALKALKVYILMVGQEEREEPVEECRSVGVDLWVR